MLFGIKSSNQGTTEKLGDVENLRVQKFDSLNSHYISFQLLIKIFVRYKLEYKMQWSFDILKSKGAVKKIDISKNSSSLD